MIREVNNKRSRRGSRKRTIKLSRRRSRKRSRSLKRVLKRTRRISRKNKNSDGNTDNSLKQTEQKKAKEKIEKYAEKNNFQTVIDAVNYIKNNPKKVGFALLAAAIAYNFYYGGGSSGDNSYQNFNSNINRPYSSNFGAIIPFVPFTDSKMKYVPLTGGNNRCYMNASIQFIYSISSIRDFFDKITEDNINNLESIPGLHVENNDKYKKSLKLLKFLFSRINNEQEPFSLEELVYNNENFYKEILKIDTNLEYHEQEDAKLFITSLLEPFTQFTGIIEETYKTFSFKLNSKWVCINNTEYFKEESACSLELEVINIEIYNKKFTGIVTKIDIQKLINYNTSPKILADDDNKIHSAKTDKNPNGECKTIEINYDMSKNDYIIISLKRYKTYTENNLHKTKKIKNEIYPSQFINFDNNKFIIVGCILHRGPSVNSGHYVYQVFTDGNPDYIIDDSAVVPTAYYNILEKGYVYLYKRVGEIVEGET